MSTEKKDPYDVFKDYKRKFIQLSRDNAMLIHLFEKDPDHSWEDVNLHDFNGVQEHDFFLFREAAKQFILQLEGKWCRAFLQALRDECDERIKEDVEMLEKFKEKVKEHEENENI